MTVDRRSAARLTGALLTLAVLAPAAPLPASAQSRDEAAAQGWRKAAEPHFLGVGDRKWLQDYGGVDGRCNRQAVENTLNAGPTGPESPRGEVAVLRGPMVDPTSVRDLGAPDRGCLGHALELAPDGRTVYWADPAAGYAFRFTPLRSYVAYGWPCREFTVEVAQGKRKPQIVRYRACRTEDGVWGIQS
jgi:surface antigen